MQDCTAQADSLILRIRHPQEQKIIKNKLGLLKLAQTLGSVTEVAAYAQLRGAGRMGSASPDAMIEFGFELMSHPRPWLDAACEVDSKNATAHRAFRAAWRRRDPRLIGLSKVDARSTR